MLRKLCWFSASAGEPSATPRTPRPPKVSPFSSGRHRTTWSRVALVALVIGSLGSAGRYRLASGVHSHLVAVICDAAPNLPSGRGSFVAAVEKRGVCCNACLRGIGLEVLE